MTKINKKLLIIVIGLAIIFSFVIVFYFLNIPVYTINQTGEISDGYSTIQALKSDSSLIARVNIRDVETLKYNDVIFTISNATITNVFKGNIEPRTIRILETGGIHNNIEYVFEENKVFKRNEKAIVFLKKYKGPIVDDAYVVLGVFQGKFIEKDDKLIPSKHTIGELKTVSKLIDLKIK